MTENKRLVLPAIVKKKDDIDEKVLRKYLIIVYEILKKDHNEKFDEVMKSQLGAIEYETQDLDILHIKIDEKKEIGIYQIEGMKSGIKSITFNEKEVNINIVDSKGVKATFMLPKNMFPPNFKCVYDILVKDKIISYFPLRTSTNQSIYDFLSKYFGNEITSLIKQLMAQKSDYARDCLLIMFQKRMCDKSDDKIKEMLAVTEKFYKGGAKGPHPIINLRYVA